VRQGPGLRRSWHVSGPRRAVGDAPVNPWRSCFPVERGVDGPAFVQDRDLFHLFCATSCRPRPPLGVMLPRQAGADWSLPPSTQSCPLSRPAVLATG
jgi:hypothetical protein